MAETNFWQQIWSRENQWPTGQRNPDFDYDAYFNSLPEGVRQDMQQGGKTQSPMGDAAMLALTYAAVRRPGLALEAIGADPTSFTDTSLYQIDRWKMSGALSQFKGRIKARGEGLKKIGWALKTIIENPRQAELAGAGIVGDIGRVSDDFTPSNVFQIKGGEGVVQRTATTQQIKSLLKDLDPSLAKRDVTKRYADNPGFLKKLSEVNANVKEWLSGKGKGRLKGYTGERVIIAPDGVKYRVRDSNLQGQTGKFSINQDISAQNTAKIRKIAQQPDEGSLKKIFSKHVPKNKVDSVLKSYNQTNKKIYTALTAARKRYNIGKTKNLQTSIEHIFDVDFYKRLKDEVPGFAGKGADEAWNLKMIPYVLNSKTGALNKKAKDIGQTLIESVRKDEFIDYNKVVKDFVQNDLGTKVNKLKPKDWDKITDFSMNNPDLNMQQILLEYTK